MLKRTHLVIGIGVALYFLDIPQLQHDRIFFLIVVAASLFPDLESGLLSIRGPLRMRFTQKVHERMGFLHTYTFCIAVSIFLALFQPILAFPFFLGYSFHLFADSFTPEGIKPFWPINKISKGHIPAGGNLDMMIFYMMILIDLALAAKLFIF